MSQQARKKPDDRSAMVVSLLNQLGDRLYKSERERQLLLSAISDLENRSDQSERIFLTLQDKLSKQDATDLNILRRQTELEEIWQDTLDRLARAEAIASRMEDAFAAQERLARRLEQAARDKAQMLRKIEAIEQAQEAMRSGALVPVENAARKSIFVGAANNQNAPYIRFRWARAVRANTTALVGVLAVAILAGYGVTQWDRLRVQWGAGISASPEIVGEAVSSDTALAGDGVGNATSVLPVPEVFTQATGSVAAGNEAFSDPFNAGLDVTLNTNQADLAAFAEAVPDSANTDLIVEPSPLTMDDLVALMDGAPDEVAAALNMIEPGNAQSAVPAAAEDTVASAPEKDATKADVAKTESTKADTAKAAVVETPVDAEREIIEAFLAERRAAQTPLETRVRVDGKLPAALKDVEAKAMAGVPEAQHDLAAIYTAGHAGVKVDYARAAVWFEEAALQNIANARYNLGVLYHQGLGVKKDMAAAIHWYRAAALLGHPEAHYNMGIARIEGLGAAYDPRSAAAFFEYAAGTGIAEAAYNLGLIHENGLLGSVDTKAAIYWYKTAADRGNPEARVALDQLGRSLNMTTQQIGALYDDMKNNVAPIAPQKRSDASGASQRGVAAQVVKAAMVDRARPNAADIAPVLPRLTPAESRELMGADVIGKTQSLTAQVQEQLMRRGMYPGPADGLDSPLTSDAIRTYQRSNGLTIDGRAGADVLAHLLDEAE